MIEYPDEWSNNWWQLDGLKSFVCGPDSWFTSSYLFWFFIFWKCKKISTYEWMRWGLVSSWNVNVMIYPIFLAYIFIFCFDVLCFLRAKTQEKKRFLFCWWFFCFRWNVVGKEVQNISKIFPLEISSWYIFVFIFCFC